MVGRHLLLSLLSILLSGACLAQSSRSVDSLLRVANAEEMRPQAVITLLSRHLVSAQAADQARLHDRVAAAFREMGLLDSASAHAWHVLRITGDSDAALRSRANVLLGFVSYRRNALTRSAGFYREAAKLFVRLDDKQGLLEALTYQARIDDRLQFAEEALTRYDQARTLAHELRDAVSERILLFEMAGVLRALERYSDAEEFYKRSLALSAGDSIRMGQVNVELGKLFEAKSEFLQAKGHYLSALGYLKQLDPFPVYQRLADAFASQNLLDSASLYADSAEQVAMASEVIDYLRDGYQLRYRLAAQMRDSARAFNYLLRFKQYDDSLKYLNALADIQNARDEVFLGASEASLRTAELQVQLKSTREREERNQQRYLYISTGCGLAAALFLSLWFFTLQRSRHRNREQQNRIADLAGKNEKVFAHMAHELQGPVSTFANLTRSMPGQLKESKPEEVAEMLSYLHRSTQEVAQSLHELMDWAVTQSETMPFRPEVFSCRKLAEQVQEELQAWAGEHDVETEMLVPEDVTAFADRSMTKIVLRTLLHHAVGSSPEGQTVTIFSGKKDSLITMGVKNHGHPLTEEQIQSLLSWNPDAEGGRERGVGLPLCRELIRRTGGELYAESRPGQGNTFYFTLPERPADA